MSALPAHNNDPGFDLNIPQLNARFEHRAAEDILRWTWQTFGAAAVASSSFQTQSIPLLHLISKVCPALPVIFIDTGFHFPETLAFRDELQRRFDLNIVTVRAQVDQSEQFRRHGEAPYRSDPDLCCYINKVEPMQRALAGAAAWVSGVRRDQTANRAGLPVFQPRDDGVLKVHPMLHWTEQQVWTYINRHDLPAHPLLAQGYASIGCAPCTRPVTDGEDARAGRWAGTGKTECGLHLER
ncbi:MAG: phosphoadenylyl-sulfate reductase [Anaerolineae bacterium]|nr:phosphoadenylyl-sulfate reductase [Anaerolineae bacterium]